MLNSSECRHWTSSTSVQTLQGDPINVGEFDLNGNNGGYYSIKLLKLSVYFYCLLNILAREIVDVLLCKIFIRIIVAEILAWIFKSLSGQETLSHSNKLQYFAKVIISKYCRLDASDKRNILSQFGVGQSALHKKMCFWKLEIPD